MTEERVMLNRDESKQSAMFGNGLQRSSANASAEGSAQMVVDDQRIEQELQQME